MTKGHFEAFAMYILGCEESESTKVAMATMIAIIAQRDNPRFDKKRFFKACQLQAVL